jgi:hypothetical protein
LISRTRKASGWSTSAVELGRTARRGRARLRGEAPGVVRSFAGGRGRREGHRCVQPSHVCPRVNGRRRARSTR